MRVAIIGAGFTGLSAAYYLTKKGHKVFVFEREKTIGGLASGYKKSKWKWSLDKHYHHLFTNDKLAFDLANKVGQKLLIIRPKTSTLINGSIFQLDSPKTLLSFPMLSFFERLRMGIVLALLRYAPSGKLFNKYHAEKTLSKLMGKRGFEIIWHPLFLAKFGKWAKNVSLIWFWARIKKRTTSLAYPKGGFSAFLNKLANAIKKKGAKIILDAEVLEIGPNYLKARKNNIVRKEQFEKIISTLPSELFLAKARSLPENYKELLKNFKNLAATNLLLRFKKPFLYDKTYWLNVCEPKSKLMAVVEHTNFIDKKFYNNESLVYIGHYVKPNHPYLKMTKQELLKEFSSYLLRLNKDYKKNLIGIEFSKDLFAQPVITPNYAKRIPPFNTGIPNVYLANMDYVYPWDRGINYAVELGYKVAKDCCV